MTKETILTPEVLRQMTAVRAVDIVVGIHTYNHAATIGHVLRSVLAGLTTFFPEAQFLVVNSDGGSQDQTTTLVNQAIDTEPHLIALTNSPHPVGRIIAPYSTLPGRSQAYRVFFEIAHLLNARACVIVDAGSKSLTPEWVDLLIRPVLNEGFDYVSPLYLRHKYDGTITGSLIYPLTRALYGKRLRQAVGDDFGFSGKLVSQFLEKDFWHNNLTRYSLDIWLGTIAVAEGFKVCQSFLGPKLSVSNEPHVDLSSMLRQVVGAVFTLMEPYRDAWLSVHGSEPSPVFGFPVEVGLDPISVNLDRMLGAFRQGVNDLSGVWKSFLPQSVLESLTKLAEAAEPEFCIPDGLWTKTVIEFAVAYHKNKLARDHLIKSMTPLYLGRTASFVIETQNAAAAEVENKMELLCLEFENQKPYLIERWKS